MWWWPKRMFCFRLAPRTLWGTVSSLHVGKTCNRHRLVQIDADCEIVWFPGQKEPSGFFSGVWSWLLPACKTQLLNFGENFMSCFTSRWEPGISHGGIIYTVVIGQPYKAEPHPRPRLFVQFLSVFSIRAVPISEVFKQG